MEVTIDGTVQYIDISGGFWGILDHEGKEWRPAFMPEELQQEGLKVSVDAEVVEDAVSMYMWGTEIDIIDFRIDD